MFTVSEEEFIALENQQSHNYKKSVTRYLLNKYSSCNYQITHLNVVNLVDAAFSHANLYHFETERDLLSFAEHSLLLGFNFENDPQFPWAKEIISNQNSSPWEKINKLQQYSRFYLERVHGCGIKQPITPYQLLRTKYFNLLQQSELQPKQLLSLLSCMWPKKTNNTNSDTISLIIGKTSPLASVLNKNELTTLVLLLGFNFDTNPYYPWAIQQDVSRVQIWMHLDHLFGIG